MTPQPVAGDGTREATTPTDVEALIRREILRLYDEVASDPGGSYHFYHGREAAEHFGYDPELLDQAPAAAVASFAGVGNPHRRARLQPGETVLDVGSGAGLDAFLAARAVGPTGRVLGVDLNPAMCRKAEAHVAEAGLAMTCHEAPMESLPVADESVDVVISNGVLNLSFRKARVIREMYRVLRPGGRLSIVDMVTGRELPQSIVNDPALWAS